MRVRAKARGFDGLCRREVGDEFDLPDTTKLEPENDWFVVIGKQDRKAQFKKGKGDEDLV